MGNIRKPNRLPGYDYSTEGRYFVTICAKGHAALFGQVTVGPSIARLPEVCLSAEGKAVEAAILGITCHYPSVQVEQFVIMPNHVHLLLGFRSSESRAMHGPTLSVVIQQMKGHASKLAGKSLWQLRYYDHIVRDGQDYDRILEYIQNNPAKWTEDRYFVE